MEISTINVDLSFTMENANMFIRHLEHWISREVIAAVVIIVVLVAVVLIIVSSSESLFSFSSRI